MRHLSTITCGTRRQSHSIVKRRQQTKAFNIWGQWHVVNVTACTLMWYMSVAYCECHKYFWHQFCIKMRCCRDKFIAGKLDAATQKPVQQLTAYRLLHGSSALAMLRCSILVEEHCQEAQRCSSRRHCRQFKQRPHVGCVHSAKFVSYQRDD